MEENQNIPEVQPIENQQVIVASGSKRNWTSYLKEFLMLFLAVFCGFLAENYRENLSDQQKEKQYIHSLVKDVELDIISLKQSLAERKKYIFYFDSLIYLLKNYSDKHLDDIYYYSYYSSRIRNFRYHDRTITQLKNNGNMRLIRNSDASDSITIYDNEIIKTVLGQQESEINLRFDINSTFGNIFNAYEWDEMMDSTLTPIRNAHDPALFNKDEKLLNNFVMKIIYLKTSYRRTNNRIELAIKTAEGLRKFLIKKYDLSK